MGCEICNIGFINWIVSFVFPISGNLKNVWWISQVAHLKRQADESEQDFSIRRKAWHWVVLLKRFKTESQKGEQSLKCPVSQCVRLPAVLSGDAGKTFLINTHERQIGDEWAGHREKQRERECGGLRERQRQQQGEWGVRWLNWIIIRAEAVIKCFFFFWQGWERERDRAERERKRGRAKRDWVERQL